MITIACILNGDKYGPEYVNKLERLIDKYMTVDHRLVCLTTRPDGIECEIIHDDSGLPTWWAKLPMFNPEHLVRRINPQGMTAYMDIDTVITGSLDWMADYTGNFAVIRDVYRKGGFGGGVWMLGPGYGGHIWRAFDEHREDFKQTDMQVYEKAAPDADIIDDLYPGKVLSYKVHCRDGLPEGASIVRFHGTPKMTDLHPKHPLREAWENA